MISISPVCRLAKARNDMIRSVLSPAIASTGDEKKSMQGQGFCNAGRTRTIRQELIGNWAYAEKLCTIGVLPVSVEFVEETMKFFGILMF